MKTKKRTRIRSHLPIPDDWDGESWCSIVVCLPDSLMWRVAVSGQLYELTRGRTWDGDTGTIVDAQAVGKEIFESVDMNCTELTRIADALENMYDAQFVNIDDVIELLPDGVLKTLLQNLGNLGEALDFLLPNVGLSLPQMRILSMISDALDKQKLYNRMDQQTAMMQAIALGLNGQSGRQVIDDLIENQLPGQAILDLLDLLSEQQVSPVSEDVLASIKPDWVTGKLDDLDLSVTVDGGNSGDCEDMTTVINNYGCGCCGEGQSTTTTTTTDTPTNVTNPGPLNGPVNQIPPPGFDTWDDYVDHKCRAAHHIYDQLYSAVGFMDNWVISLASGGIGNVLNLIAGIGYYWMTSETLTAFVANLFSWAIAVDSPPAFWSQMLAEMEDYQDLIVCTLYEAPDTASAIQSIIDVLTDAGESVLVKLGLTIASVPGALVVSIITNLVGTSLINDLFQDSDNVPDEAKTCDCASQPPTNTGVCYSMNTAGGVGTAQLLSDDGSLQVWRVTPAFDTGVYKLDLKAYDQSNGQIPYQVTAVAETSTPSGGFDLIEYNLEDGSQVGAFQAGCMDNIRYEDTSPGWSLDVTVDLVSMDNCNGCTELPPPIGNCIPFMDTGTGTIQWDGTPFTVTSVNLPGDAELVSITNDRTDPACTDQRFYVEFLSFSISPPTNRVSKIFDYVGGGVTETQYDDVWPPLNTPLTTVSFDMRASGQFQVTMRIYGVDPNS